MCPNTEFVALLAYADNVVIYVGGLLEHFIKI